MFYNWLGLTQGYKNSTFDGKTSISNFYNFTSVPMSVLLLALHVSSRLQIHTQALYPNNFKFWSQHSTGQTKLEKTFLPEGYLNKVLLPSTIMPSQFLNMVNYYDRSNFMLQPGLQCKETVTIPNISGFLAKSFIFLFNSWISIYWGKLVTLKHVHCQTQFQLRLKQGAL